MVKTVPTRYGEMAYIADDYYIGRALELYGEYGELELAIWRQFIQPGWKVCDIGANIGCFTVPLAQMVGEEGKVYAFEPQPELYQLLKRNTDRLPNVVLCPKAVGQYNHVDRMQTRIEHDTADANQGSYCLGKGTGRVEVLSLDHWLNGRPVDFLKVDVEGHEVEVLLGAERTIMTHRPMLFVEDHPANPRYNTLFGLLQDFKYTIYQSFSYLFNPDNFNANAINVFDTTGSFDLLCIPQERAGAYAVTFEQHQGPPRGA